MKVLEITSMVGIGSIGKIAVQIQECLEADGNQCVIAYAYRSTNTSQEKIYRINGWLDAHVHNRLARITGCTDSFSIVNTLRFINWIKGYCPDVIHLHMLQENYLNLKLFFSYLNKAKIPVVWTFHDCRAFTGGCTYFTANGCDGWKTGCKKCTIQDFKIMNRIAAPRIFERNKKLFTTNEQMVIVTPSQWLSGLVRESFLGNYPVKVIHNGIDLSVFRPTPSDFRKRYHCAEKFVILGVAAVWGYRKGLDVFCRLAECLDGHYQIVLVGTNAEIDKTLPQNIISIHRTHNQRELAELYTAADLFLNPTREDNFPTTNIEALACGTPVMTFDTGGSPEIPDETCGCVVPCDDLERTIEEIQRIEEMRLFSSEACILRAGKFNNRDRFDEYISLYDQIAKKP